MMILIYPVILTGHITTGETVAFLSSEPDKTEEISYA